MSKKNKRRKAEKSELSNNCFYCDHCMYIGEGDHICDVDMGLVVVCDWTPTEDFYKCGGKDFVAV